MVMQGVVLLVATTPLVVEEKYTHRGTYTHVQKSMWATHGLQVTQNTRA